MAKTLIASVLVLMFASLVWLVYTQGLRVFTKEQARQLVVKQTQPALPQVILLDATVSTHALRSWTMQQNKLVIVEFVYTRCNAICRSLGAEFQQLQAIIQKMNLQSRVGLLSISFDPEHDTPQVLAAYAARLKADANIWHFATVKNHNQLATLLNFFGITVIPDELGGYQHNAALLLTDSQGKLVDMADINQTQVILDTWLKKYASVGK